jgi:hypothetical protein
MVLQADAAPTLRESPLSNAGREALERRFEPKDSFLALSSPSSFFPFLRFP